MNGVTIVHIAEVAGSIEVLGISGVIGITTTGTMTKVSIVGGMGGIRRSGGWVTEGSCGGSHG